MISNRWIFLRRTALVFSLPVALALPAKIAAQTPEAPKTADQVYKNLKVLQKTPADSLNQGMHLISGQLGVNCEYCHVDMKWDLDDVKMKDTARDMMRMTKELNEKSFKGEQVVTCYTCHHGKPKPDDVPFLPVPDYWQEKEPEKGLPSVSEVLSRYISAIGGEQNIRKITTRIITAKQNIPTGPGGVIPSPADVDILQKAPNLMVRTAKTKQLTLMSGFDRKGAWAQDARGRVNEPVAFEQIRERISNDFYEPLNIAKQYSELKVEGTEKIGSKETWLITGLIAPDAPVRLYFDKQTGLLVRRYTLLPTSAGHSPFQIDYDDYRDAGNGVKYAYRMQYEPAGPRTELATHSTIEITRIQENVPIEDTKFIRPVSKESQAR